MKFEKLFAVSIAAALAAAATGCRYNKAGAGADGAGAEGAAGADAVDVADGQDEEANVDPMVGTVTNADDGSIASAVPFDQNPAFKPGDGADFAPVYFGFAMRSGTFAASQTLAKTARTRLLSDTPPPRTNAL